MANKEKKTARVNGFRVWRRLLRACLHTPIGFVGSTLLLLLATACIIYAPFRVAALTDLFTEGIANGVPVTLFAEVALSLVVLYLLSGVLSMIGRWVISGLSQHVSHHLRYDISKKINRLPASDCEGQGIGDLLSCVINDMDTLGHALHEVLAELLPAMLLFLGSLLMMLLTNWQLALLAALTASLGGGGMLLLMRVSQKYYHRQQKRLGALNDHVQEVYGGLEAIKAANAEGVMRERFCTLNTSLERGVRHAQLFAGFLSPLMAFCANFSYVVVCVVGSLMVLRGTASFGVVVAFMFFVHNFIHPFAEIAKTMQGLQSAAAAGERVFALLDAPELDENCFKQDFARLVRGEVEFSHVSYRYPDATHDALCDVSFHVSPGQKVAIVGPSGSGKSTLLSLLSGLYLPREGEVRIDGISTSTLTPGALHRLFAPVFRNAWMFEGSVRENLVYCAEDVGEEEMRAACRAVGIDHFIRTLPRGYDTVMGEEHLFSEGQLQQLEIARALLSRHPMLMLDEATGAIDPRHELAIAKALDHLTRGRTTFVVAHRTATIENADLVIVLKDGRVDAMGTHRELLCENGFYAAMWNARFLPR